MARSVNTIVTAMQADLAASSLSSILTSTSLSAIYNLWIQIVARAINLFEQAQDAYFASNETLVTNGVYATTPWIQYIVKQFQYNSVTAQVVQILSNFSIQYPVVNPLYLVVGNCSVTTGNSGLVSIKVSNNATPPQPLDGAPGITGAICTSLNGYLDNILPPDMNYVLINANPDTLSLTATVYYNGQYNAVIQANVIVALNTYISSFSGANFNGKVKLSEIESIILGVEGVTDCVLVGSVLTPSVGSAITLVAGNAWLINSASTYAGYIVNANTPNDFASTLTFVIQN